MFDNEVSMKRINVFTGHFGSGKTEIAINYAKKLKQDGIEKVSLVDLDIVNPYFCSREFTEELGALGIRVISQGVHLANAELMVVCRGNRELADAVKASIGARMAQSRAILGTPGAGGYNALVEGADAETHLWMRAVTPLSRFIDVLL